MYATNILLFFTVSIGPKRNKNKKQCYVKETHMEQHVYFIYNILKRKLQVCVMPGICIKNYIKTKKKQCVLYVQRRKNVTSHFHRNMKKINDQKI